MPVGVLSAPAALPNVEFHGVFSDTTSGTHKRTFSSVPFGNPASDRRVIVGYIGAGDGSHQTVTIGGTAATLITNSWTGANTSSGFWERQNYSASDTSGTIEVTPNVTSSGMVIAVWSISRFSVPPDYRARNFAPNSSDTYDRKEHGVVFGIAGGYGGVRGGSLDLDYELFDLDLSSNALAAWGGVEYPTANVTGATMLATMTGTEWTFSALSYGPE